VKKLFALVLAMGMLWAWTPAVAQNDGTVLFTDSAGRSVQVPEDITRIAPTGILGQILLFALAPEYFVGLSVEWTEEAEEFVRAYAELPLLGNLYGGGADLNLETLAAQGPQVIIDIGESKDSIAEDMDLLQAQIGIPVVHIGAYAEDYASTYRMLGQLLGLEQRAEVLAVYCEETYANILSIMAAVDESERKELLYCLGPEGLNVLAQGSFHAKVIDLVGSNLAVIPDFIGRGTGEPVDMERLMLWDPEYIVFAANSVHGAIQDDPLWQDLRAVRGGKTVQTPTGPYPWLGAPASVQYCLGMLWLCDLLYPEATNYDLQDAVTEYYRLFYHHDLTQAQYDALMQHAALR